MSKTIEKHADILETTLLPSFDPATASAQFRALTEKGVEQSNEALTKLQAGAETAQKAFESSFESAKSVTSELSLKTIEALRANTEAGFSHLEALVGAKSFSEVIELQTTFIRKSVETAVEQAKELQTVTTKAAEDVSKPLKAVFEKAVKELKVA